MKEYLKQFFYLLDSRAKKTYSFCQSLGVRLKSRMMKAYQYAPYLISRLQDNLGGYIGSILLPTLKGEWG